MPEKIDYKQLFETTLKITGYSSVNLNGFLKFFLQELLILTESRRGFVCIFSRADQMVMEISGSDLISSESTGKHLPGILGIDDIGLEDDAFSLSDPIFCNRKSRLYLSDKDFLTKNVVNRFLSVPLEEKSQSPLIVLVADKKTDYSIYDFNFITQLSSIASRAINNLKSNSELKYRYEMEAEKVKIKNSFIRFISHEIKTPLNSITGFSQLLGEENQSAESCNKFTDIILESSYKLVRFINSVNEISDIETGLIKIVESDVSITQLLSEIYEHFKPDANLKKLQFHIQNSLTDEDLLILADRDKVKRVIVELLTNSFQHTFTGSITFGCELKDSNVQFFVTDTGTGITDADKSKVFCYFLNSGDSVVKSSEGAGLGLTISKEFVEHMGGKIWFDSSEGIGTSFYFSIPYKNCVAENVSDLLMDKGVQDTLIKEKSILVAEDDNMNFYLIKEFLSKHGYNLIRAMNGREAVELCSSSHFDLVLMDIRMPEMDGYTATQRIREINPKQIIVAQTAYTNDREIALAKGCNDFIAKPFGRQQLIAMIRNYI